MSGDHDITLGQLLDRATSAYNHIIEQPTPNDEAVQSKILAALADLSLSSSLINRLAILSPNETLEDINTSDLKCLSVEVLRGLLVVLLKTKGGGQRKKNLEQAKDHFQVFCRQVEAYEVIPRDQIDRFKGPLSAIQSAAMRRESKISQYKLEKQLKQQLDELRERKQSAQRSRLYSSGRTKQDSSRGEWTNDSDDENEGESRSTHLTWLKFLYLKAHQELDSIEAELDILGQAAQMNDLPSKKATREEDDLSWRVERLATTADGPLVSPSGKVLRPFTILPSRSSASSASTNRIKLRAEVFRPDWTLPTMTIDDYLDEQRAMGNFLSGGGPDQANQETPSQRAQIDAEEDNAAGELKAEQLRKKAVEWNEFTDVHRKGEGNMMNRG
ncbi:hypothetical protein PTTG_05718 [Puccinia triticina 1-1 BBBD Race 1]|uniref:TAP42-like protein n=2 Tax=Puccinia triticina TaxID=208348 RepID=A0A0C4EY19_PUCT1|nr:uncharacterized protein PtA15_2A160 [Puccinia triticina]OAV92031.1 hypothetical protein PTTG_05718 [Puccinia triticina 1-1 BBBD Race 1]WAQ81847.1 hypothetical protein PtA15_2A160 [Puccinia triticina]WAR52738.1 hypothetical protein PtB15_2B163 [Puccinia triticina]